MTDNNPDRLRCARCDFPRVKFQIHGRPLCGQCYVWDNPEQPYQPTYLFGARLTRRGEWVLGAAVTILATAAFVLLSALIGQ